MTNAENSYRSRSSRRVRTHRSRALALLLSALIGLPVIGALTPAAPVSAAGGVVNVLTDGDGAGTCAPPTPETPGTCPTLRAAVNYANSPSNASTTIVVPKGRYTLGSTLVITGAGTTIEGAFSPVGVAPTLIDANGKRAFDVRAANVTISGVAITKGNAGNGAGGAILVGRGADFFTLAESTIFGNVGRDGAGLDINASNSLVERSTFVGNNATRKGGGIRVGGTLSVVASTFTDNGAQAGGAMSVSGSAAISYSTFVDNSSNNSKGGGVDRNGGTVFVTGSILTNSIQQDSSGTDCSGNPNLVGPNFVGNDQGCQPGPETLLGRDGKVALAGLANNGGATQTMALRPGPGVDIVLKNNGAPVPVTVCSRIGLDGNLGDPIVLDQRREQRPFSLGQTQICDLGAFEIGRFDAQLELTASTETPPVGASTIPAANIPSAVTDTQVLFDNESGLNASPIKAFPIKAFPLEAAPMKAFPIKAFEINSVPIKAFPIKAFFAAAFPIKAFPIKAFPMKAFPLDTVLLSDLVLLTPGGWEAVLKDTPLEGVPLQALTLTDVQELLAADLLADPRLLSDAKRLELEEIDFADLELDGTPLANAPTLAFLLWSLPMSKIDAQWCDSYADFCVTVAPEDLDKVTPLSLVLAGESLDAEKLADTQLGSFFDSSNLESFPMKAFPMKAFDLLSSPMKAFPMKAFPMKAFDLESGVFDCAVLFGPGSTCSELATSELTLGDVTALDAWAAGVTLEDFIALVASEPALRDLFDAYGLYDLLVALIPPASVPWEQLDLTVAGIQNAAEPLVDPFQYYADITLSAPADTATLEVVLPEGFAYVPGGSRIDTEPLGAAVPLGESGLVSSDAQFPNDPVLSISDGTGCGGSAGLTVLTYALTNVPPGRTRVEVDVRAGLTLGTADASACLDAVSGAQTDNDSSGTLVTVTENTEKPLPAIRPLTLTNDNTGAGIDVNLGYVTGDGSVDLYSFYVSQDDANLGIQGDLFLSNLPADYDLVLYSKPSDPLRKPPTAGIGYIDDVQYDLNPFDDQVQADTVEDVPQSLPDKVTDASKFVPVAISSNRNQADELIQTGTLREGTYYVQVSAYNGTFSNEPYALRFQTTQSTPRAACAPLTPPTTAVGVLPDPTKLAANVNTLFLVNKQLLASTYGPNEADRILVEVNKVANAREFGVSGAVIPVDGELDVRTAYADRFLKPCDPQRSNDVVREIGRVIDRYTAVRPGIENIVIIGDDRQIPMANITDDANFANERTFAQDFVGNNESISALVAGMYRTDDPYGTDAGIRVRDHELFVPERAVGRLVETPDEIIKSLTNFMSYNGRLDPDTAAATALQTGYEFLQDGAELNARNLEAGDYDVQRLFEAPDEPFWKASDLATALGGTSPLDVIGIHAHFDENNALPAFDNYDPFSPDGGLFDTSDFPLTRGRAVVYSMGCHAGYSRSDIQISQTADAPDWAQHLVGQAGNVFAGNTGFGYGDSEVVALSESLTAQFATEIAQNGSIGQAWVDAKQRTLADVHILDAYQEKVIQQFVFYGLPMFHVGVAPTPLAENAGQTSQSTLAAADLPDAGFGSLKVDTVVATPAFAKVGGDDPEDSGDYYTADDGKTLQVNGRPIQPLYTADVTQPGLEARGALITGLTSALDEQIDPVFFKASTDFGQPRPEYFDGSFPAELANVRSFHADGQDQQQLLLAVGQFRGSGDTANTGKQRRHTRVETEIYYGQPDPAIRDLTPPSIDSSRGYVDDKVVYFEVEASDVGGKVERVYVLYRDENKAGRWTGVDLALAGGVWRGGRAFIGERVEFAVQAVDSSGNVAMSDAKSLFFLTAPPTESGELQLSVTSPEKPSDSGWYSTDVVAKVTGGDGSKIQYSIDGDVFADYTSDGIAVTENGGHVVTAIDGTGIAVLYVAIDKLAPSAFFSVPAGWVDGAVKVAAEFDDGAGSGVKTIDAYTSSDDPATSGSIGTKLTSSYPPVGDPADPVRRAQLEVEIPTEGVTYLTFVGTDDAGNTTSVTKQVKIDSLDPVVTVTKTPDREYSNGDVIINVGVDAGGSPVRTWYTIGADEVTQIDPSTKLTAEGTYTVTGWALDEAGNPGKSLPLPVNIDKTLPVPSLTLSSPVGPGNTASFSCADAPSPVVSGIETDKCVLAVDGVPVSTSSGAAVTGVTLPPAVLTRPYVVTVTATDKAGNSASTTATYTALQFCPDYDASQVKKIGSNYSITGRLCANGINYSSADIVLEALSINGGAARPNDSGNANNPFEFRLIEGPSYTYNLDTSGLPKGTNTMTFRIKGTDAPVYSATFKLR